MKNSQKSKHSSGPKIIPLGDKVLLKEIVDTASEKKTDSGIFIPDSVKEDKGAKRAKVVAIGEGTREDGKLIPLPVHVGDEVLFQWGDKITIDGEEYYLVRSSEIAAKIK